ncbi:MAG: hypothetical protein FWE90_04860 [Defluviitaleaceae bacterium]|nr:hypothetical protein [Defluviitaleaceae bacterium]
MKYRKTLAATALIGLMAITGCSRGAFPENNEANYNGERLVRSVTRNADGYTGYNRNMRNTRGFTRNLNRQTDRYTTDNTYGLNQNRHTGVRSNNHYNRSTRGLRTHRYGSRYNDRYETGRMDHTFGYENSNYGMELNRNYLNTRTHRADRNSVGNRTENRAENRTESRIDNRTNNRTGITLNDNRQQTVPVIAVDDNMEANSRVAEFFAARRNRTNETNPNQPDTQPMPAPNKPDTQPMPAPNQKPDTQPMPAPGNGNETTPDTTPGNGTHKPAKVHPNAKRAMK